MRRDFPISGGARLFSGSAGVQNTVTLGAAGFSIGRETRLVRAEGSDWFALDADGYRCKTLLSILDNRPLKDDVLLHLRAAASHWQRGDKALANLRLALADLPRLKNSTDADRLQAAEYLLDEGMSPRELMGALGLDPVARDFGKYSSDQPRVPAGSGRESGQWTDGTSGSRHEVEAGDGGWSSGASKPSVRRSPKLIQVAANGPFSPAGIDVVPVPPGDTLDPKGLNKQLDPAEQQVIADTVNAIIAGGPDSIPTLNPHSYDNRPDRVTGAVLPAGVGGYTTYYARSPGYPPGGSRILMDRAGSIYYTNNHYRSFYPVDIRLKSDKMLGMGN